MCDILDFTKFIDFSLIYPYSLGTGAVVPSLKKRVVFMKLNINCLRDTLLSLEEWLVLNEELEFCVVDLAELCKTSSLLRYSKQEIAYTLVLLEEAGLIKALIGYASDCIYDIDVVRLTFQGHQFLDSIRPLPLWKKILSVSEKTGLTSVTALAEISNMFLPEFIKSTSCQ